MNAHRIKDDNTKTQGHYYYSLAKAEGIGFTMMKTVRLDDKTPTSTTTYARIGAYSHAYEDIRAAWMGFPVKKTLGITGWAMAEGGIQKYVWSADGGKTWSDCSGSPKTRDLVNTDYENMFYDASSGYDANLKNNHDFEDSIDGLFGGVHTNHGSMLKADLSSYVGQVVDVIFAAKPNGSDVYVPIGRVDNVSVWGTGEKGEGMGPFYSFTGEFFYEDENNVLRKFSDVYTGEQYSKVTTNLWGGSQNNADQWNLKFQDSVGGDLVYGASHSIYEPYNVNPTQMRKFYADEITVRNGARFQISGFMMCHGGVAKYKLSLDGGETFVDLQCVGGDNPDNSGGRDFFYARRVDATFDEDDVENSTYSSGYGGNLLEFYLPAQTPGARRELLVVAEGFNGYDYPVLRLSLRIAGDTPALVYYQQGGTIIRDNWPDAHKNDPSNVIKKGYNAVLEEAPKYTEDYIESEKTHLNTISAGDVYTASTSNRYRLTVPVEEVGLHSLRFYLSVVDGAVILRKIIPHMQVVATREILLFRHICFMIAGKPTIII